MKSLVELLKHKNHFLEKFYSTNENELKRLFQSNFDNLDNFYHTRDSILEVLQHIDQEINKMHLTQFELTEDEKRQAQKELEVKEQFVSRIINQDLEILQTIENEKNKIIIELSDVQKSKKAIKSYIHNQKKLTVDEEL
jgi:hypothetical protein